ncbi:hypothetical protein ACRRTK_009086 [Alexandromys fortis]
MQLRQKTKGRDAATSQTQRKQDENVALRKALSEIHRHSSVTGGCCSKLRASSSGTNSRNCKTPSSAGKWDDTRAHRPLPAGSRDMFQESVLSQGQA